MIETANQAMNALDAYWVRHETPEHQVIAQVHQTLQERATDYEDDWKALLDVAMKALNYRIDWQGQEVHRITKQDCSF
ncbi:hypothetical protein [Methylobacterium trifolii]|uniref:hypothetical protein n=1 Tax=Methylobacterium trifolii TaxID=1003092 RepID=UPI001EDD4DDA|nr:hypothetical protein [Methylobacterium trifolii]